MNVNVYLPDDLGEQAKQADLPFSRLLQEAVRDELERKAMVAKTLDMPQTYELELEDSEGRAYTGRITGKEIGWSVDGDVIVYLTEDERVIVHDSGRLVYQELSDPVNQLPDWFPNELGAVANTLHALGEKPVIDL
jgi:hypothetical protein